MGRRGAGAQAEPGILLRCSKEYLPTDRRNTAYRAAQFFLERCGLEKEGVSLSIHKRIPGRAGMGGGSADAAAVLLGLNEMFDNKLELSQLLELAAKVGADVPFCLHGAPAGARASGRCWSLWRPCRPAIWPSASPRPG